MERVDEPEAARYRRLMTEALVELESLQAEVDGCRRAASEPIAVVGLACRFPGGANDPESFWSLLREGRDAVRAIPPERWDVDRYYDPDPDAPGKVYCRHAALVDREMVEGFCPEFFGIAPREAERMDPQQRMLLEVCWETLEDAALPAERLRGSRTGLFVGSCTDDYLQWFNNLADPARIDGYSSLGTARCITAGRISYLLGLEGPALQLDTACSSSLVAVHQACASLRSGECDAALAGGVNLQLSPVWTIGLCKLKALAPDGLSKTFDVAADGFGRGEGCGMLLLKRLTDALADGDPIRAVIRGSAVNHDGRSSGLTVPSQAAQERLLRQALAAARLEADALDAIEAHGTGTTLGDPIEIGALAAVFGRRSRPLWIGSVKTNIGHLEAAAGIAGLAKLILALAHEAIPPHLHFHQRNPLIPWGELPARIPVELTPWARSQRPRLAGVSSFGFSGTNAHVIVEEAPAVESAAAKPRTCHVLVLSAKSRESLLALAQRYVERLESDADLRWSDVCYTAAVGRSHFPHRLAVAAQTSAQACQRLRAVLRGESVEGVFAGKLEKHAPGDAAPLWPQPADVERADAAKLAAQAGDRYVRGLPIDWETFFQGCGCRRISLPTYAFQRQRYWLQSSRSHQPEASARSASAPANEAKSLAGASGWRGRRIDTPHAVLFEMALAADRPALLADHRVGETVVLPAAAQLEMAVAAARTLWLGRAVVLEDMAFQRPLTLPEGEARVVQIVLTPVGWVSDPTSSVGWVSDPTSSVGWVSDPTPPPDRTARRFELFSRVPRPDQPNSPAWARHTAGRLAPIEAPGTNASLDDARRSCSEEVSPEEVYDRIARQGLRYGPSFRLLQRAWRGRGEALGWVALAEKMPVETEGYWLHPGLFDSCLHVAAALRETDSPITHVPVRLERFEAFAPVGRQLWSHVRLCTDTGSSAGFAVDVDLFDPQGQPVARLRGLRFQPVDPAAMLAENRGDPPIRLAELQWRPSEDGRSTTPSYGGNGGRQGRWLILADDEGLGDALVRRLRTRGEECVVVRSGDGDRVSAIDQALAGASGWCGVVHLWGLSLPHDDDRAPTDALRLGCGSMLQLVQALATSSAKTRLWMVTRGAQAVQGAMAGMAALAPSALWGMGRVIALEHPELACMRIDLDPALPAAEQAELVLAELTAPDAEDQVAYRAHERYAARIAPLAMPAEQTADWGEGPVLITGGLGDLGLAAAEWLAERGVRRLVLTGRRMPQTEPQRAAIARIGQLGAETQLLPADIADAAEVERLLATVRKTCGPLRGVIHAAGVLDDGVLRRLDWPRFERVLLPKAVGAWHLHRLAGELDYFILFSSAVGLIGSLGQASYAAADVMLDALAVERRRQGLPALSIAWGPWDAGMTARLDAGLRARMAQNGLRPMAPADALRVLDRLFAQPLAQVVALDVDWPRLAASRPAAPLWLEVAPPAPAEAPRPTPWLEQLRHVPPGNRMRLLVQLLRGEIAAVLGWDSAERVDPKENLFDLGMDSLTSVELQQRMERGMGCSLPLTLAFDYPTVQALAGYIARQMDLGPDAPSAEPEPPPVEDDLRRVAGMTDQEVEAELFEKYKHLL